MNLRTAAVGFLATLAMATGHRTVCAQTQYSHAQWVRFEAYAQNASLAEIEQRFLSPLMAAKAQALLIARHERLAPSSVDLAAERFLLFVPAAKPAGGYGLLVFVPASDHPELPQGWAPELEDRGLIFVAADRSGNDQDVMGRREPLAVLALENVRARFPLDSSRIYVAGFSGGSRVAMRLALEYPDLFRGALLNAGSDPIGSLQIPIPARDLFLEFQSRSRLVFVTGNRDDFHTRADITSISSLSAWCAFGTQQQITPNVGHDIASGRAFGKGLDALTHMRDPDPVRLATCRRKRDAELDERLGQVNSLLSHGEYGKAKRELERLDESFGGYAAPRSLELLEELTANAG